VIAEVCSFAYSRCADSFEAQLFTDEMGRLAFDLPVYFTALGFMLFLGGTTHFFVMQYRVGLEQDSFTICAAFCYMMPPFVIVAILKMHYSLNNAAAFTHALKRTKGFTYDDIRYLMEQYLSEDTDRGGIAYNYLDADLEGFIRFAQSCKIVGDNQEERAGKIQGLRRKYVEQVWDEFYKRLVGNQGEKAKHEADLLEETLREWDGPPSPLPPQASVAPEALVDMKENPSKFHAIFGNIRKARTSKDMGSSLRE
jgi:DNA-binding transcriptional MerR regulator